ncbi:hypothetical protein GCM10025785_22940 [Corynebacterium canis]
MMTAVALTTSGNIASPMQVEKSATRTVAPHGCWGIMGESVNAGDTNTTLDSPDITDAKA